MNNLALRDYFTDYEIAKDPYPYFEAVRAHGPVWQPPGKDYLIVTGFEEYVEVSNNHQDFSGVISLAGAAAPLPFEPEGGDITAQIEAARSQILGGDQVVMLDDEPHTKLRGLMTGCSPLRGSRPTQRSSKPIRMRSCAGWSPRVAANW